MISKNNYTADELLWIKASIAYYESKNNISILPIMSDDAFDALTESIKKVGSKLPDEWIGGDDSGDTKHPSPMLSLEKIKFKSNIDKNITLLEIKSFIDIAPQNSDKIIQLKYDGHGYNYIYKIVDKKLAVLDKILTRGRNNVGHNKIHKLRFTAPNELDLTKISVENLVILDYYFNNDSFKFIEVRGEFLMKESTFNSKYKEVDANGNIIKNSRTIAGGILSKDEKNFKELSDLYFIAFEFRLTRDDNTFVYLNDNISVLNSLGFNSKYNPPEFKIKTIDEFGKIYDNIYNLRVLSKLDFQIDGLVVKHQNIINNNQFFINLGFTSHHPKGGIAIKFPSIENISTIIGYEWNTGFTGEVAPKLLIDPIIINGSTIKQTTGHNLSIIKERGLYIGAQVIIEMAGDIIPIIRKKDGVINPLFGDDIPQYHKILPPTICPSCRNPIKIVKDNDTEKVICDNQDCEAQVFKKIAGGLKILGIKDIGESRIEDVFNKSNGNIGSLIDYFNKFKMNYRYLSSIGLNANFYLDAINKVKKVPLKNVIQALRIPQVGNTVSEQIAKCMSNVKYDFFNLNKEAVSYFINYKNEIDRSSNHVKNLYNLLVVLQNYGVVVEYEKDESKVVTFEMTGEPPTLVELSKKYKTINATVLSELKHKDDYIKLLIKFNMKHSSIAKAQILLTDSYSSNTGKMKTAKDKSIKILSYEDLLLKLKLII